MRHQILCNVFAVIMLLCLVACSPAVTPTTTPAATAAATDAASPTATAALQPTATREVTPPATPTLTLAPAPTSTDSNAVPAIPTSTVALAQTNTPTRPPGPTSTPPVPNIVSFTATPTTPLTVGEDLSLAWEAIGEQASICLIGATGPFECQDVPLKGEMTITVTETMLQCTGIGLRVAAGDTWTFSIVDLKFECPEKAWFFENPPSRCAAEPAIYSRAAVQYFEHGFMVWTETPDRFYVFFDEGVPEPGFQQFIFWDAPYTFVTPEPVDATPPDGYYAPVSGFGRVWRGELQWGSIDVSELLGWATAPEFEFEAVYQCEIQSHPHIWTCYLRGPDGVVLSLGPDSSAMVRYLWQRR